MESVLLKSMNFNVRSDKDKDNYILIYVVLYVGTNGKNRQYRLPLTKVIAKYWDSKQHLPILTAKGMSSEVREQQLSINQLITDIKCALCVGNSYTIDEIRQLIEEKSINIFSQKEYGTLKKKKYITGVDDKEKLPNCQSLIKNQNKMVVTPQFLKAKRTPKATKAVDRVINFWKEKNKIAESTIYQYKMQMGLWKRWVATTNQRDGYSLFTEFSVKEYRNYLLKKEETTNNINLKTLLLCKVIRELSNGGCMTKGIKLVDYHNVKLTNFDEDKKLKDELKEDDINAFEQVTTTNDNEVFFKKLFLFQIAVGQRVSDLCTIIKGKYEIEDGVLICINKKGTRKTKKEPKYSYINYTPQVGKMLKELQAMKIPRVNYNTLRNYYNRVLKILFKRAKITRNSVNGKPLCEEISSHYARHTFCTRMIRKGYNFADVALMMGCNENMVQNTYQHLHKNDKIRQVKAAFAKVG